MVFIDHASTDANFNFALEKYAMDRLDIADEYFMFWRTTPTLMIGRFQNTLAEINTQFVNDNNINVVRRISGGGTIYTDMNGWQFSFITKNPAGKVIDFAHFTKPIIDALASLGVTAYLSGRNDLLIDGKKFSGNAQYKNHFVNLHHGSILFNTNLENLVKALNVDDEKIIAKGIKSVRQRVCNVADAMAVKISSEAFRDVMVQYLTKDMTHYTLNNSDISQINKIKAEQFDAWDWNYGKSSEFNIKKEARFAGGKLSVHTQSNKGVITDIAFYGDFFAQNNLNILRNVLIDTRYEKEAIRNALSSANADDYIFRISAEDILSLIIE